MSYRLTLLTLLATGAVSISSGPGPVETGPFTGSSSTGSVTSAAASYTSTCGALYTSFESYCCSGELVFPQPTGSPQGTFTTDVKAAALSEPNAIVPSHSIPILPGTQLASGVTCFGSVVTLGAGATGGGGSGSGSGSSASTTSSGSGSGTTSSSGAVSTTSSPASSAAGSSSSGAIVGSSTPAGSFTTSAGPTVSGAAARDVAGGSLLGGLFGLVVALL